MFILIQNPIGYTKFLLIKITPFYSVLAMLLVPAIFTVFQMYNIQWFVTHLL